jgi:very-short-patch-repair endonuclease
MRRHARDLRHDATIPERILWGRLRRRQLAGFKFRRQHQIGLFICDFASLDASLIVELDGNQHAEQIGYDSRRDEFLRSAGFRVLRFWNDDVVHHTEQVVDTIFAALSHHTIDGRLF